MFKKVFAASTIFFILNAQQSPEELVATLSLREKIGQLFVVAAASNFSQPTEQLASSMAQCPYNMDPQYIQRLIKEYNVGGVIFLFKSDPVTQMALANRFNQIAKIPLLIAQDCEWGLSMRLDIDPTKVVRYPRNMTLGAIKNDQLVYEISHEIGNQCAAIGVHMNCAPVVDVNNNKANPVIHDRSFGDNPERVARLAQLCVHGLHDAGVLACAKHFPGHGDTHIDSHINLPVINHGRDRLEHVELVPFQALIKSGIDAIMHAHLCVPELDASGVPSSLSYDIVTRLVRHELGFDGLNITDGLGMDAVMKRYEPGQLELAAFLAGHDILLCPLDVPRAVDLIEQAIKSGRVSEEDLNHRVLKILRAKKWAFEHQKIARENLGEVEAYLTRPEAYQLQRQAYRAAVTLVQQHAQLSFDKNTFDISCIVQIGNLPDNALKKSCQYYGRAVLNCSAVLPQQELDTCINEAQKHDTIVIAIGQMNKFITQNFGVGENTLKVVEQLHKIGKKIIIVLFGTPYSITLFQDADVILAAYEDAPAAQEAVVDVLRGQLEPAGKLPVHV